MELIQGKHQELHLGNVRLAVVVRGQGEMLYSQLVIQAGVRWKGLEPGICELSAYWCHLNYEMIQSMTACTLEFSFLSYLFNLL